MTRRERLDKLCDDIINRLLIASTPSITLEEAILRHGKEHGDNDPYWYWNYYISEERFSEIYNQTIKDNRIRLSPYEKQVVSFNVHLGQSPTTSKNRWLEKTNGKYELKSKINDETNI